MSYHIHFPSFPLSRFVEQLFLLRSEPIAAHREQIMPDGRVTLMFNLGEPQRQYNSASSNSYRRFDKGWITGQRTRPIVVGQTKTVDFAGVVFQPWGAYPFLRMPLSELKETVAEVDALWGPFVDEVREQVALCETPAAAFSILESMLHARLDRDRIQIGDVAFAASCITQSTFDVGMKTIVSRMGISHKQLTRRFRDVVGITPKKLSRVERFRQVLHAIPANGVVSWVTLAHQFGFCDQSHLNREFRELGEITPTRYLELTGDYPGYVSLDD